MIQRKERALLVVETIVHHLRADPKIVAATLALRVRVTTILVGVGLVQSHSST